MARYLQILWIISLPAIFLQLGIKISCNGQTPPPAPVPPAPIPPARADDTVLTIPGCEVPQRFDCLVAKTAFSMPEFCKSYATTLNCVIYLSHAFCGDIDLPDFQNDTTPLQNCINYIRYGPCEYNPTGRACTSKLFSSYQFLNDPDPPRFQLALGGAGGWAFELQTDIITTIFGEELDYSWDPFIWSKAIFAYEEEVLWNVGQFIIGVFKNLINIPAGLAKLAILSYGKTTQLDCYVLRKIADLIPKKSNPLREAWDRACRITDLLRIADEFELPLSNDAQRAGDRFATIVGLILPVLDVAKALGITAKVLEAFNIERVAGEVGSHGYVLRASDKSNKALAEIWAQDSDGSARPMTKEEIETLKDDIANRGFRDLEDCIIPGHLRKRVGGQPYRTCVETGEPSIDPTGVGDDYDAIFGELADIMDLQRGQPIPVTEAGPAPAAAAPVEQVAQAQYLEPLSIQPAARTEHYAEDLTAVWVDRLPADSQGVKDISNFNAVGEHDEIMFGYDAEDPVGMVLDEAGPSDPQQFQDPSPLGIDPPELPPSHNLPVNLILQAGDWDIIEVENFSGLSAEQQLAIKAAGDPKDVFDAIIETWESKYKAGLPSYEGPPIEWSQAALMLENQVDTLAHVFKEYYHLSDRFISVADGLNNGRDFRALARCTEDLVKLPVYEGIAYFWRPLGRKLGPLLQEQRVTKGISYVDQNLLNLNPNRAYQVNFMKPGLPFTKVPNRVLFFIQTKTARLVGPALQIGEPTNLIYTQSQTLFRFVGTMQYLFAKFNARPITAFVLEEILPV